MQASISDHFNAVFLLLGANLGDRWQSFRSATKLIEERIGALKVISAVYETAPWGVLDQPSFLNQVLEIETTFDPETVLRLILQIEHELGRVRHERWAARLIDIDLLYFNDLVLDGSRLTVPHPRLHERRFTLAPLAEIAPDYLHPILKKTNKQLLEITSDQSSVHKIS